MSSEKSLAVLMTCHNRCIKTINTIKAIKSNKLPNNISMHLIVVDDGSSDGTADSIATEFPDVTIITGSGNLFWNRGMRMAFLFAKSVGYDFYLWLNDDTELFPDAIARLLSVYELKNKGFCDNNIIVGSTKSAISGCLTYGGYYQSFGITSKTVPIYSDQIILECNNMNGNCVLISSSVARIVGDLDDRYQHSLGDIDYALRAWRLGVKIWVAPGFVGICERNAVIETYQDKDLSLKDRWSKVISPKGLPYLPWFYFTKNHLGVLWPLYWVRPYIRIIIESLVNVFINNFSKKK